jgi:hypothetical protein
MMSTRGDVTAARSTRTLGKRRVRTPDVENMSVDSDIFFQSERPYNECDVNTVMNGGF